MMGFLNTYELSGKEEYPEKSLGAWLFTQNYLFDKQNGEWFWGVYETYEIMTGEYKAGFWKCPYHNARACIKIIKRINNLAFKNSKPAI